LTANQKKGISNIFIKKNIEQKDVQLVNAEIKDVYGNARDLFNISEDISLHLKILCNKQVNNIYGYILIKSSMEEYFIETDTFDYLPNVLDNLTIGENDFNIKIPSNILPHGDFIVDMSFASHFTINHTIDNPGEILKFTIHDTETKRGHNRTAKTSQLLKWELQNVK
jgi:hypothetical protein